MDVRRDRRSFTVEPEQIVAGRDWCRSLIDQTDWISRRRDDIALCVTELFANAVAHSTGNRMIACATRQPDTFEFRLASGGPMTTIPPWPPQLAEPDSPSGRGLYVAHVLSDTFDLTRRTNSVVATARFLNRPS